MPWRLVGFIFIFAVFLIFIAFNLGNNCDISFGFRTLESVPVYLTAFSSFVLGMLCAIPFALSFGSKKNREGRKQAALEKAKKTGRKGGKTEDPGESPFDVPPELRGRGGPYGID